MLLLLAACAPSTGAPSAPRDAAPSSSGSADVSDAPPPRLERFRVGDDLVAVPRERFTPMWNDPTMDGGSDFRLDTQNPTGRLAPLLIEGAGSLGDSTWYRVLLPIRPNGTTAWVRAADVVLRHRTERIVVDLSRRLLWHFDGDRLVDRFSVAVGSPATPTGTGRFYVWVKVSYADPTGPYGSAALGLSGFSPVLSEWPGQGRMAVHGTANPGDRGRAVSHGCVRVYNGDLGALLGVPLGTPVVIRP
jgi:hypothetical protein